MLNKKEMELLHLALEMKDPNIITEYFMRHDNSGTVYKPLDQRPFWKEKYQSLYNPWVQLGKPNYFGHIDNQWQSLDIDTYQKYRNAVMPVYEARKDGSFFEHHGYRYQDWQKKFFTTEQPTLVCIGGRGSGKTTAAIMTMLVEAVLYPDYYCICPAPSLKQSRDNLAKIELQIRGTKYEEKFEVQILRSPELEIRISTWDKRGKKYISVIKFYTIHDFETFRGYEVDRVYAEQAELFDNIVDGTNNVFSTLVACLRGYVPSVGRDRIAKSWWVANASHNFGMYKLRDRAIEEPHFYYSLQVSSYDNMYLKESEIAMWESSAGGSEANRRFILFGDQPIGEGEIFPQASIEACFDGTMDKIWQYGKDKNLVGYDKRFAHKSAYEHFWKIPYDPAGSYIVSADPGQDDPPNRNAAGVCVFRVDEFPVKPAQMYAFHWVYGKKDPRNWATAYIEFVNEYRAKGNCAYDATGLGSGYENLNEELLRVNSRLIYFTVGSKNSMLNVLRTLMARGLLQMPNLQGLIGQLMNYVVPEPPNLRQDLVAMLMIASAQLDPIYQSHVWVSKPVGKKISTPKEIILSPEFEDYDFTGDDRWARY